jgi:hypothetical protein
MGSSISNASVGCCSITVRNSEFADVVQERPSAHVHERVRVEAQAPCHLHGKRGDARRMALGFVVAHVEHAHPALERGVVGRAEFQVGGRELLVRQLEPAVPIQTRDRAHPRAQFETAHRFGDEIVCPGFQAGKAGFLIVQHGDHHDGHAAHIQIGPQAAAHLVAIDLRQHHVEEHDIRAHRDGLLDGLQTVAGLDEIVGLAREHACQRHAARLLVVHDQHHSPRPHGRSRPLARKRTGFAGHEPTTGRNGRHTGS